jgi:alkylated DNA repair protein (DNA oxidative demethylase)
MNPTPPEPRSLQDVTDSLDSLDIHLDGPVDNTPHPPRLFGGRPFVPDLLVVKSFLSLAEQREIYEQVLTIDPGFYVPKLRNGATMNLRMNCLGYHWSAVSYKYTTTRDVDGRDAAPVPPNLQLLADRAARASGYWAANESLPPYDICIVNWYDEKEGKLGVHADNSESAASLEAGYPVVSLSIGASCVFTISGLKRTDPQREYILDSGDLVVFGRSLRLAYHGVKRLLRGTTPLELGLREPGRLNLTFRIR